jgi:SAM-dependent methyltransferase
LARGDALDQNRLLKPTLVSLHEENEIVTGLVSAGAARSSPLEILEAGCGRTWSLVLPGVRFRLTGVDLDAHALEARKTIARDLDEAIVGDVRSVSLGTRRFDVVFCAYVLEHVEGARAALENFARWLKPGGLLVLRVPDRDSAFGFVARSTPFWFHVAVWRYVYGSREAGTAGHAPYPAHYDPVLGKQALQEFCSTHGLVIRHLLAHSGLEGAGALRWLSVAFLRALGAMSGGALSARHNNLTFVIEKTQ